MSANESALLNTQGHASWAITRKTSAINGTHTCKLRQRVGNAGVGGSQESGGRLSVQKTTGQALFARRAVYLDGFKSHEDVVRAYLESSGIDPNSREGRFYFSL